MILRKVYCYAFQYTSLVDPLPENATNIRDEIEDSLEDLQAFMFKGNITGQNVIHAEQCHDSLFHDSPANIQHNTSEQADQER